MKELKSQMSLKAEDAERWEENFWCKTMHFLLNDEFMSSRFLSRLEVESDCFSIDLLVVQYFI